MLEDSKMTSETNDNVNILYDYTSSVETILDQLKEMQIKLNHYNELFKHKQNVNKKKHSNLFKLSSQINSYENLSILSLNKAISEQQTIVANKSKILVNVCNLEDSEITQLDVIPSPFITDDCDEKEFDVDKDKDKQENDAFSQIEIIKPDETIIVDEMDPIFDKEEVVTALIHPSNERLPDEEYEYLFDTIPFISEINETDIKSQKLMYDFLASATSSLNDIVCILNEDPINCLKLPLCEEDCLSIPKVSKENAEKVKEIMRSSLHEMFKLINLTAKEAVAPHYKYLLESQEYIIEFLANN